MSIYRDKAITQGYCIVNVNINHEARKRKYSIKNMDIRGRADVLHRSTAISLAFIVERLEYSKVGEGWPP
jgi:hypothetical protein